MEEAEEEGIDTTDDELRAVGGDNDISPGGAGSGIHSVSPGGPDLDIEGEGEISAEEVPEEETVLPTPDQLGAGDFTDLNNDQI